MASAGSARQRNPLVGRGYAAVCSPNKPLPSPPEDCVEMKKILCLLFLIIFISCPTAYAGERPKEFRGLFWGTHISKVEGLVLKKDRPLSPNLPRDILEKMKETLRESRCCQISRPPANRASTCRPIPGARCFCRKARRQTS